MWMMAKPVNHDRNCFWRRGLYITHSNGPPPPVIFADHHTLTNCHCRVRDPNMISTWMNEGIITRIAPHTTHGQMLVHCIIVRSKEGGEQEGVSCKDFSVNIAQEKGDMRKRNGDRARTRDLHSFPELQPHEPSVPAANPLPPIALCTGRRCAAIQRPLEDPRLEAGTVCGGNGLSG